MTELHGGTVTFLFTDIEGSTRLLRQLGECYEELVAEHQRLLRESAAASGGREIDTQGDSFFFAFPRAKDAVRAAAAAQRALADHTWPEGVEGACAWGCTPESRRWERSGTRGSVYTAPTIETGLFPQYLAFGKGHLWVALAGQSVGFSGCD